MIAWDAVVVAVGSAVGALARHAVSCLMMRWIRSEFPWATWVINITGAFLLGLATHAFGSTAGRQTIYLLSGQGFCGGFTTFSTMAWETVVLFRKSAIMAVVYVGSSVSIGLLIAWTFQLA